MILTGGLLECVNARFVRNFTASEALFQSCARLEADRSHSQGMDAILSHVECC